MSSSIAKPVFVENLLSKVDIAYSLNRDSEYRDDVRQYVESAYQEYSSICPEKDFQQRCQDDFHAMMWQLHLAILLKRNGFSLEKADSHGPDIIIACGSSKVIIEAMDVSSGDGANAVPDIPFGQAVSVPNPDERVMFRIIEAMEKKMSQYNMWLKSGRVLKEWPFIIALNTGTIAASTVSPDYSDAAKSVFALGASGWTMPVNVETGVADSNEIQPFIEHKPIITSPSGVKKPSDWFLTDKALEVSALLWSGHHLVNAMRTDGKDCELILNANATNKLPDKFLPFGKVTWAEFSIDGTTYIVRHKNVSDPS